MEKVLCLIVVVVLVGCGDSVRKLGGETYIGSISGCDVSEVETGGLYPAFITRCKEVVTKTSYVSMNANKTPPKAFISITTITEDELRGRIYQDEIEKKKQAVLNKLSDEDKNLLKLK